MSEQPPETTAYPRGNARSGSSLFLLELIISIGFFAVAGVVCINMFLHAHRISEAAARKTAAVSISQNCAESFLASDGDLSVFEDLLRQAYPDAVLSSSAEGAYTLAVDSGSFLVDLTTGSEPDALGSMQTLRISVQSPDDSTPYTLEVRDRQEKGGGLQ